MEWLCLPARERENDDDVAHPLPRGLKAMLGERIVAFRMCLTVICDGDQVAGLFLAQALYWSERARDPKGWFYKSQKQWEAEIGLTRHQLDRVRALLGRKGFVRSRLRHSAPAVLEYQLDLGAVEKELVERFGVRSSLPESDKLEPRKPTNHGVRTRTSSLLETSKPYKEAESTSESTKESEQRLARLARADKAARAREEQSKCAPQPAAGYGVADMWRDFNDVVDGKRISQNEDEEK